MSSRLRRNLPEERHVALGVSPTSYKFSLRLGRRFFFTHFRTRTIVPLRHTTHSSFLAGVYRKSQTDTPSLAGAHAIPANVGNGEGLLFLTRVGTSSLMNRSSLLVRPVRICSCTSAPYIVNASHSLHCLPHNSTNFIGVASGSSTIFTPSHPSVCWLLCWLWNRRAV